MKKLHPKVFCSLLAVLIMASAILPIYAESNPTQSPEITVSSSHAIQYGSEASLSDGVYGGYGVDDGGWVYVQTAADGTDNHVTLTADLGGSYPVYKTSIGTIVNGWAEPMQNLKISYSEDGISYTELAAFDNADLSAPMGHRHEWTAPEGTPITASKLLFEFDIVAETLTESRVRYTCIDEIDVSFEEEAPIPPETEPTLPPDIPEPDPGGSINLAAGKSYTSTWEPASGYSDDGGQLTDGIYCRTLSCKAPEWVGYYNNVNDGFDFILDLEEKLSFEQIKMNFLREESSGIPIPLQVRIELSDDGVNWNSLASADVTPIEEGIGIKRFVYTVPEDKLPEASARYIKLHINFRIWLFIDEIEVFDKKTADEGTDLPPDELPAVNLANGLSMECSRELLYNAVPTILTDEVTASALWNTSTWLSFKGTDTTAADSNQITMVYDLGGKKSVSEIRLGVLNDSANGVSLPKNLRLELSDNAAKWTTLKEFRSSDLVTSDPDRTEYIWDGSTDSFITNTEGADMVYFQYLRISFDCSGAWCAFDELTVTGKDGKCSTAGTLLGSPDSSPNVALGKTYTLSHNAHSAYKDTDGKELTDGALGSMNMYDSAWQGHQSEWPIRTIILDLEKPYALEKIQMNFLQSSSPGVIAPSRFCVYVSDDGQTWASLYSQKFSADEDAIYTLGWDGSVEDPAVCTSASKVQARYIRVDAELNGWLFIDELEAYGTEDLEEAEKLPQDADFRGSYKTVGPDTGNIQDLVLMYNGPYKDYEGNPGYGCWNAKDYKPYVAYVDENGKAMDTMFDGVLFLAQSADETGHLFIESSDYGAVPSNKADWDWYLTKTIDRGGDMDGLNQAVKETAEELKQPGLKMKVTIMVPFPDPLCTDFGEVNGTPVDMSIYADAQRALDWYMEEVLARFNAANYEYLEFAGYYWMHETNYRAPMIRYASEKAMTLGYPMLWIPFYNASGWNHGDDLGISAVALQPNHFFPDSGPSMDRISDAATLAKMYHLGMELEMDDRVFNSLDKYNKYLDYLNGGIDYGYFGNNSEQNQVYRNWYNGIKTLMESSTGVNPYTGQQDNVARSVYDFTYQAIKGTYEKQEYRTSLEPDPLPPVDPEKPTESSEPTVPSPTTEPEDPTVPDSPMKPEESTAPTTEPEESTVPTSPANPDRPATGDQNLSFLFILLAISLAGVISIGVSKKKF